MYKTSGDGTTLILMVRHIFLYYISSVHSLFLYYIYVLKLTFFSFTQCSSLPSSRCSSAWCQCCLWHHSGTLNCLDFCLFLLRLFWVFLNFTPTGRTSQQKGWGTCWHMLIVACHVFLLILFFFCCSLELIGSWFLGDVFKTFYFFVNGAPVQFKFCGITQITVDTLILFQIMTSRK